MPYETIVKVNNDAVHADDIEPVELDSGEEAYKLEDGNYRLIFIVGSGTVTTVIESYSDVLDEWFEIDCRESPAVAGMDIENGELPNI